MARRASRTGIGINDVKVQVLLTGICSIDLDIYEWNDWAQSTIPVPMVIGHEFVDEIVAVGSNLGTFVSENWLAARVMWYAAAATAWRDSVTLC